MIISRTPMRITMAGGGTDLLWYTKLKGGAWISAGINKYLYITLSRFEDPELLKISDGETITITDNYKKITNPIIRECLDLTGIKKGIEITTMSDASGKSGLGGSGAFEVGLLHALHAYKREPVSALQLAKEACEVEIERLKKPVGPQDQYITALGGLNYFELNKKGSVKVTPLNLPIDTITQLENNLLFFRTGIKHETAKIHGEGKKSVEKKDKDSSKFIQMYDDIKELGQLAKKYLLSGKIDEYGATLHEHWLIKTRHSSVTNTKIDEWINEGIKAGALGGKIMGAGGGGWFMFYVNKNKNKFRSRMQQLGLAESLVRFDEEGSKIMLNLS
jgi:D-glycero-alpha-D-manno-heptose-7-phosphate kinase